MGRTLRFAFAVIALAVSLVFALLPTSPASATQSSTAPPIAYNYNTPIYDPPTAHTALERGSSAHAVGRRVSAGQGAVDRRSNGSVARPETSAAAVIYAYDVTAQLLDDASIGAAGKEAEQAVTGKSSLLSPGFVAAKAAPQLASGMERTGSALAKSDPFHRSVSWVVDNPAAQRFGIKGGDGVSRELYQLPGEVNGKSGVFEWIIDRAGTNPLINHQRFIPGGSVTGFPNQVAP